MYCSLKFILVIFFPVLKKKSQIKKKMIFNVSTIIHVIQTIVLLVIVVQIWNA